MFAVILCLSLVCPKMAVKSTIQTAMTQVQIEAILGKPSGAIEGFARFEEWRIVVLYDDGKATVVIHF